MKRDLFSFKENKAAAQNAAPAEMPPGVDPRAVQEAQSAMEHYSGMSENELMEELQGFRRSGAMSDRALEEMRQRVAPMLNAQQRQKLDALVRRLKG